MKYVMKLKLKLELKLKLKLKLREAVKNLHKVSESVKYGNKLHNQHVHSLALKHLQAPDNIISILILASIQFKSQLLSRMQHQQNIVLLGKQDRMYITGHDTS